MRQNFFDNIIDNKMSFQLLSSRLKNSPVAQAVEQVAVNHPVGGSNPSGGVLNN